MINFLLVSSAKILAQNIPNAVGNEAARATLNAANFINDSTRESWDRIWENTITPEAPIWQAVTTVGTVLASITIIIFMIQRSEKLINSPSVGALMSLLRFPLVVLILFANNAVLLSQFIDLMRGITYGLLADILQLTNAGIRIDEAIQRIESTGVANARAREIFSSCIDQVGLALEQCVNDPLKIAQATDILQSLTQGAAAPFNGNLLEGILNNSAAIVTGIVATPIITATSGILIAWQWGFVNAMEVVLILTATVAPLALGLSLIYSSTSAIFGWFSGFAGLLLYQFGYAILVGLSATILSITEQIGGNISSLITDLGFLLILGVFAPFVAVGLGGFGGLVLFRSLTGTVEKLLYIAV